MEESVKWIVTASAWTNRRGGIELRGVRTTEVIPPEAVTRLL